MARWPGSSSPRVGGALAIAIAAFVIVLGLRAVGLLEPVDLAFYDLQRRSAARAATDEPPVTLVLIGEADIRRFGHPLSDATLKTLIEGLLAAGPRALGVDLYRDMPVPAAARERDPGLAAPESSATRPSADSSGRSDLARSTPDYDALGRAVLADRRVVMTMKLPDPGAEGTPAPGFLDTTLQVGFSDWPVDSDGTIRRGLLYLWDDDVPIASLALQLALRQLGPEGIVPEPDPDDPDQLKLGPSVIPPLHAGFGPYAGQDDAGYQFLLDYRWGSRGFTTYSLADAIDGALEARHIRDRIVLVGTGAASVKDSFYTPMSHGWGGAPSYGVEVHAQAAHQLIRYAHGLGGPLRAPARFASAALILLGALIGAGLGLWNRALALQALGLVAVVVLVLALSYGLFSLGWWLPAPGLLLVVGLSAVAVVAMVSALERAERRELLGLFSRFQGVAVADEIWRRRAEFTGEGGRPVSRRVVLTALMSDLEGYTAASEKMEPQALMSWVGEYMNTMAELVEQHGGVVDDYAGDGIKANFGFPLPSIAEEEISADAAAAVRCALAMGERMQALNASWQERGLPTGRCRVGIYTGPAVVGCIGGDRSLKYTSVGDTVNTAARLEGFGKDDFLDEEAGTAWRILIGEQTLHCIGDAFSVLDIGAHPLKGKDAPVPIYRVIGEAQS